MADSPQSFCPFCGYKLPPEAFFCPSCGKPLKGREKPLTFNRELWIYSISLFLPPFGLWYVWKYYKKKDATSRRVWILALVITIISVILTIKITQATVNGITQTMNELNGINY